MSTAHACRHCDRASDVYVASYSSMHGVAPKNKWVVVASARVEASSEGGMRWLWPARAGGVLPLLKPSRKLLAEVTPY